MTNDKILKTEHIARKTFSYELNEIKISFTLRTDVKKELLAAIEILHRATVDFNEELKKIGATPLIENPVQKHTQGLTSMKDLLKGKDHGKSLNQ